MKDAAGVRAKFRKAFGHIMITSLIREKFVGIASESMEASKLKGVPASAWMIDEEKAGRAQPA